MPYLQNNANKIKFKFKFTQLQKVIVYILITRARIKYLNTWWKASAQASSVYKEQEINKLMKCETWIHFIQKHLWNMQM